MTEAEMTAWADKEIEAVLMQLDWLESGLGVRYAGLFYFLPLCHDAYGEGNA